MRLLSTLLLTALVLPAAAGAQVTATAGGFVDAYYAYDFGRPPAFDRSFTTQPARHNEFNINLAFLELKLNGQRLRGRVALQAGTSVQSNYGGEPSAGAVSGPLLSRHLQEATAGVRITPGLWADAGVFFSHIGSESFVSRDNLTYTRSLMADYSPYYQAGVKLTWTASPRLTAQLNLVNGWQIVSENNDAKAAGLRIDFSPSGTVTLSAYNFVGNEQPAGAESRLRVFQGASVRLLPTSKVTVVGTFDFGWQAGAGSAGGSTWYGTAWIGRLALRPDLALAARVERYHDPDQVIVATGSAHGFRVTGGSLGLDATPVARVLWRTEARFLDSRDAVFPDRGKIGGQSSRNTVVVTSLGVTF